MIRDGLVQIERLETLLLVRRWSYYADGQGVERIALVSRPDSLMP